MLHIVCILLLDVSDDELEIVCGPDVLTDAASLRDVILRFGVTNGPICQSTTLEWRC